MAQRNTIQKAVILETVKAMCNHPTADEVFEAVSMRCPNISKATVYRNLNRLADDGVILRVQVANAPDRFDKTSYSHCHFICKRCGRVFDYDFSEDFKKAAAMNENFVVDDYSLLFTGHCKKCEEVH